MPAALVPSVNTTEAPSGNQVVVPFPGSPGDPTLAGMQITVYNASGSGEKTTIPLPNEVWTEVKLVANLKNGTTDVLYNGLSVLAGVGSIKHTTTSATVRVGAIGRAATIEHEFRYDDVTVAVFR